MKVCSRCKIEKEDSDFRMRHEKRKGDFYYLNNTCRKCDSEISLLYHNTHKNNNGYKQKARNRVNKWRKENHEYAIAVQRKRIATDGWKKYMREYNERNKNVIVVQSRLRNRKYVKDIIENIKPTYIVRMLSHPREGIPAAITRSYPELIASYQIHIATKRLLKTKNNPQWIISYNSERLL